MTSPSHFDLMGADYLTWSLGSAVDDVCTFASKGKAEEEALRLDAGALLEAKRRLDNLIQHLGIVKVREAA